MEEDSYERQLQEYGHSQRERRERSSQSPPGYDDLYYERGSQSGQDYDVYESHRYSSYRSLSPGSDRDMDVNNEEYSQYKARTPSDERYYYKEKFYEESRSRDRSHSSDSEQRYRLTSEVVRRRSRSRSPTIKLKRTKELPISYRSHSPPTPTDDEPYFHSDNSPSDFDSAYRKFENYRKRPSSVDDDKKSGVLLNTGLRKEIEAKTEGRISRKRSYDQLSPKRADSLQRLERQHSRGSRADSLYEYSAKELLTKVQRLRSELNERTGVKDSPSSGSSNSDIDPSTLTEAELAKLHREKTKLLQKLNMLDDAGNNSDNDSDSRHASGKKARLEHKYQQKSDTLTKQEIKEKLKLLDETQNYRKQMKKELLRDLKKSKSAGDSKKDLFDYSEDDSYNSPKKRRKVDSESDKRSRAYRGRDDEHGFSSDDDKERLELIRQSSAHADLYSPKSRTLSSLDARLESDVFASHSKEDSRRVSSGSDNNKEQSEHSSRSHRRKNKKDNHITPLIPLGDDEMPDPETSDPRIPRGKCERPMVLPLPEFAQFIQFSPLPSPCHSPQPYSDLPTERERRNESATGSGEQSPCFSPQSSSSKTHSPSQSPSGSGSDSKGNTNSESGSGDAIPPGFPTETEQIDPDENKADSLDSVPDPAKAKENKPKTDEDESFSDNNSDIDLTSENLSIEERIRQLDEKWNKAQAVVSITQKVIPDVDTVVGINTTVPSALPAFSPSPVLAQGASSPAVSSLYSKYKIRKRNDAAGATSEKSEQSEIVQTVLSKSSIFDQDSKRLGQTNDFVEGKDSSPSVNDNSPKTYSAWNKNDTKENPMVTVPGSLLDRLGQGSNGSFPTLTVNTTFPSVTNNVSMNNPAVSCSSGLYNYDHKPDKLSPLVNSDILDKNFDSQVLSSVNNKSVDDSSVNSIRDQSKEADVKLWNNDSKVKSEDVLNDNDKQKTETGDKCPVKVETDTLKAEYDESANVKMENGDSDVKDEVVTFENKNEVSQSSSTNNPLEEKAESKTDLKLDSFEEMDTSTNDPVVLETDTKPDLSNTLELNKEHIADVKTEIKKENADSGEKSESSVKTLESKPDVSESVKSETEIKIKGILKKSSESDSLDKMDIKWEQDSSNVSKTAENEKSHCDKVNEKDKHLHKQSSTKSDKDESVKEPSHKKQKLSKDKEKRSDSSHKDEKHRKKENEKKSESSHKSSNSSEKKDEKNKEKEKTKSKSDKDKKDSEKKSSASKEEKKESKDEKKKKSEKKDKEKKEEKDRKEDKEKKEDKPVVKEVKEEKNDKLPKEKKEEKPEKDKDKSVDKKAEKKEKHEKKDKDGHKHSKHGKSPDKKAKSSHKDSESKENTKDKSKESTSKESGTKDCTSASKEHASKDCVSKETEKEKSDAKEKEKSEKKNSDQKKEHKSSSHKVKKSKDESSSSKKVKEETDVKKPKEDNTESKKSKDDEKKTKDDHNEHKKKDEVNNRNNKDSPDKSKDVNRKESSEKKSSEKAKEKANGEKCKEEKSKSKEKENKDKDPDHSKTKSRPSSTTDNGDKPKVYSSESKVEKTENEKDDSKKSESKKEEKKNKDSEIAKNSNSASKLSSKEKDTERKSSSKPEKSSKSKSSESKSKIKTPDSGSKSKKDSSKKKEKESPPAVYNGLTEEDRLIFAQFAEEPYMSMYDKVKRRSTEKKMHCEREQEEQKKLLHEYKRGSKGKKASLSDITESSEPSSDEDKKKSNSVQKTKKKFVFSSDDSDSSTDTNVLQTKSNKSKSQTKKPKRILDIYSSDSEEDEMSAKTPIKKPVTTKKKKAEVHRDNDHKFEFDSISDSDNKTSATQQAKAKTAPKSNKKPSKPKTELKSTPKSSGKKDSKPVKPKRNDLDFKYLFSDDSDESMLSDTDSDSDIMITAKAKKKTVLTNHKTEESNKKKLPRGSSIYTSSESETDDEFKPMSPPKTTVLPKKVERRDSFFKEPIRKDRESDSFSSDHDEKHFERSKKDVKVNHNRFSDSFDSDGFSSDQQSHKYKGKNHKLDQKSKINAELDKRRLEKELKEEELKDLHKLKTKKFAEIITDEHRFQSLNKLEVAKVYSDAMFEKETMLSNLTNKDNVPPVLTDITKEPLFKLDVDHVRNDIPALKDISLDSSIKTKNKKHKKENKKKKKNKEKSGKDTIKDGHEQLNKKVLDMKPEVLPRHDGKQENLIPDSDSENTAVNRNLFDVMKSPGQNNKKSHKKKDRESMQERKVMENHDQDLDNHSDTEFGSEPERKKYTGNEKKESSEIKGGKSDSDIFDFQDDDNGIKPIKESHMKSTTKELPSDERATHDLDKEDSHNLYGQGVEIEYTTDVHDYKDEGNVCPEVETTEVVIEQAVEEKIEKEKAKPKKRKARKNSGRDTDRTDITQEAVCALVKDERQAEDIQTEIVPLDTPVSNDQELVIDEGVSLHVEDETDKAVESIVNDVNDETAKAVESILLDGMPTYAISEPVEPTPQLDQNYLQPEFAPGLPNVPQVGTEVETNTSTTPLKGKKGRKGKRTKSGQGDTLLPENANKMVDGKPFDLLGEDSFASVMSNQLDTNDDDDDGRLQIDFDPPKPEAKQKKPRKPKQTKVSKMNDAAALAVENKLDNLFGNFHRSQEKEGEINRDSLSSESSELERSKHEDLLFMDREDQRHDSDMMSPDERSTSDDLTSPTDVTKVKSRRGRKPKNKDPASAPIPRTNSPRASRALSPRSPRSSTFDPRSPKSDGFEVKVNGPKVDDIAENKGNKLGVNVFDFDDNDEHSNTAVAPATPNKQRKPYRRRKGENAMQSPNRGIFSPEHKFDDKLVIASPECNGMFSPEHKVNYPGEKKALLSPAFQPEEQKVEVKSVADDKPPEPLFKAFFEAKSKTEPEKSAPSLSRKNSKDGDSSAPTGLVISNVDKTIDNVSKGLFESTDDESGNGPSETTPSQKKRQTKKSKEDDMKSPGAKSPIKSPVAKSPMVKSPGVNPLNSPPASIHPTVHHQPLVLPGMGQPMTSQPQIGEPQLAGHVPMMSPPIPVSTSRPAVHPVHSAPEVSKQVPEASKNQEAVFKNILSPGKSVPQSPVRNTTIQTPQKSVPLPTVAQSQITTTTSLAPSTTAVQDTAKPDVAKPENAMEGALKGAMSGFLVPGISANTAMNVVQVMSSAPPATQTATVVSTVSDLQKRQQQQMDRLAQEQQLQLEQKQAELQRQQEHHIKLKEQELKELEKRKELERIQIEQNKKLQEELKNKEEKKKQLELLHEQLQRQQQQQQQQAMHGVKLVPGGQPGQPPLLSPGAIQRARPSLPSPADKQGPRPPLAAHHQLPPGAPFGLPGQHPGAPGVRPGQLPGPWAQGLMPLNQDELIMKHQQLQQQIAAQAQAQKVQSLAEFQAQLAKQQAQQVQAQTKQSTQQAGKAGSKAAQNTQAKKSAEIQVTYVNTFSFVLP